ncbi:uncharacterized protein EV422DRAFT_529963 [Fimicolochytrium jonesii]|uniref:uncharacterized protein n=1 Tax=Fimicolochytrium jonesii TaxID=1396493 RepID=UPI0022FEFD4D|nr:uncharacterized protein EV422DRAFT_529963 [Fimicolochytrium jonesii]KAI8820737.1 hypothetical protein EV422DRAFT_529963 [Fimicolochytrium jonesii]
MHDTADNMALESRFDDIERELIEVWSSLPAVTSGSTKSEEPAGTLKRTELSKDAIEEMSKRSIENMQELAEKQKLLEQLESAINKFDDLDDGDVVQPDDGGKAVSSSDEPSKGEALRDGNESSPSHRRTRSTASESDQWHAAAHSRVYVAPVKPRERKNSALPPMILQRMDEEYQSLVGSPMPPPRKDVLPPTAETFAESTKVPKTFQSITVKTFHLPAKRTTDNSPKPSGSLVNSPRSDVSRGKPDEPKTEVPKPPKVAKPEEAETPAEAADVISGLPKLAIPPRRKIPTTHVQEIPVSAFGARRTPPSRTASLLLSASPIAMSAEGTKSPQFSSPQSSSSSQSNSPHSNPPHSASQIPAQLQVQNPIPPARRSSMAPSIRIENSDVHASQVVAGPRFGTAFNFPPPPNRPPPSRLSVMGVLNPEPRPTARPSTLGRQFGDPTNITSFVTPYHNHPSKSEVAIESVGAPMLVTSSFRGRMIPLQDVWEDLDQRGFEPLRNGHGEKESKSGWGTLNRMINKAKAMRPGPGNNSPTTSEDANGVPLSPSQRTSTVYPSPPSSPRRPGKREAPGKFGSLGRAMGNVMRTFDVSSKSPTIASLIGQSADSMGPYMHNGRLETASLPRYRPPVFSPPDANIRRLSQIETPVGVVMDAEHERKLSSEMVEFRKHLLNTYASGPQQ